jgi:CheY-like chemotaxis protein
VLVVDDEPDVRETLRSRLEASGYSVREADDIESALNVLEGCDVDGVVLDVRMPDSRGWGRTGLEVLAFIRLHASLSGLPVMVLTGRDTGPEEQALIKTHRAEQFQKPGGYDALLRHLDRVTGRTETAATT